MVEDDAQEILKMTHNWTHEVGHSVAENYDRANPDTIRSSTKDLANVGIVESTKDGEPMHVAQAESLDPA